MYSLTLSEAWSAFRHFLRCMTSVGEEPARLAARLWIKAMERDEIIEWLAPLERLMRLLLLAEAATLTLAPVQPRKPAPRREVKGSRLREVPEDSEEWRVSFRAGMQPQRPHRAARRTKRAFAPPLYDSVPLAARIEALVRVALDPAPYAKRLARRLSKRPLSRKQTRRLFRQPTFEKAAAFQHSIPAFIAVATPARLFFESG